MIPGFAFTKISSIPWSKGLPPQFQTTDGLTVIQHGAPWVHPGDEDMPKGNYVRVAVFAPIEEKEEKKDES